MTQNKKKVFYIWKSEYPWDVRVQKMCESLAEKYDVYLIAKWGFEDNQYDIINNVNIIRVGFKISHKYLFPLSFNPIWKLELNKLFRKLNPDLIIVREMLLATLVGKLANKYNKPVIMDMAENYPAAMSLWEKYNNTLLKRFITQKLKIPTIIEKQSVKLMDGIIVVCNQQVSRLINAYSYSEDKISVIYNTPYKGWFSDNIYDKTTSKIQLVHHGYYTSEKSILNFVIAFAKTNNKNLELHLFGSGPNIDNYKTIARNENINNIYFHGKYSHLELDKLLNGMQLGVLPYQKNEFNQYTIHNKIFDYFAKGIPVLVSENKPLSDIINDTDSGFVLDCESIISIVRFLDNLNKSMIQSKTEHAKSAFLNLYNWEVDKNKLFKFIKKYI